LSEMHRLVEAKQVADIVATSPLGDSYPNWAENRRDITARMGNRSVVALRSEGGPAAISDSACATPIPEAEDVHPPARSKVVRLSDWKRGNQVSPVRSEKPELSSLSVSQKKKLFLELVSDRELTEVDVESLFGEIPWEAKLDAFVDYIVSGRGGPEIIDAALRSLAGSRFR
jgi:hypothetical protein